MACLTAAMMEVGTLPIMRSLSEELKLIANISTSSGITVPREGSIVSKNKASFPCSFLETSAAWIMFQPLTAIVLRTETINVRDVIESVPWPRQGVPNSLNSCAPK